MKSSTETEVKIPLTERVRVEQRLKSTGFRVSAARQFEANAVYDTEDELLRKRGMLLRLRQIGDKSILTWKGPGEPGLHKSRPELETSIGSAETFRQILNQLGYLFRFRYEKYRAEYAEEVNPQGVVTVDETPIGDFLEIEGPGDWIDSTAERLGFSARDYVTLSYGQLYAQYCAERGLEPSNMVFASTEQGPGVSLSPI